MSRVTVEFVLDVDDVVRVAMAREIVPVLQPGMYVTLDPLVAERSTKVGDRWHPSALPVPHEVLISRVHQLEVSYGASTANHQYRLAVICAAHD